MERTEIIAKVEAAIEALNSLGNGMRRIEVDYRGRVSFMAHAGELLSMGQGETVGEAMDSFDRQAERARNEAADRAAFEAWRRENAQVAA